MRQELIKSILDEKKKKKKKKKPIGQLYSVTPVFSDTTVGTPEGMEENESEINEMGGLSDTLGQNDLPQVPKWESGMGRGHANPIDSKIAWQSGISRGKANSLFEGLNLPKKNNNEFSYLDDVISRVEKENEPNLGRNVFRIYISGHKTSIMKCLIYPSGNFKILQIYIPFRNDFMSKFGLYDRADFEKIFGDWFKSRHMDKIISEGLNLLKKPTGINKLSDDEENN